MDFEQRLQKAIERGQRRGEAESEAAAQQALSKEELKQLHSQYRLQLSEHIESCLRRLPQHFPGFQFETIFGDRGWGAACSRNDIKIERGTRQTLYSRLEMTVRPLTSIPVIDLAAKGTIRNKELFTRNYYEKLPDVDPTRFVDLIDRWVIEFAELFAAQG